MKCAPKSDHYVNGVVDAPQIYALRINGVEVKRSGDMPALLHEGRSMMLKNSDRGEVEAVSGRGFISSFCGCCH
jgi:hypothetical protein